MAPPRGQDLVEYGFQGHSDKNSAWGIMVPPTVIIPIEEKAFLGIVPRQLRFGRVMSEE